MTSTSQSEVLDSAPSTTKTWTVGTLTYTSGALAVVGFWLLLGDFSIAMRDRSVGPVGQLMLNEFGASNLLMSLLGIIPTIIGMILGPVVSYKSDRLRSRWGRRIPYLLIPTPFAVLAMLGMAFCVPIATGLQQVTGHPISDKAAILTVYAICSTGFAIANIVIGSVFGGLVNDVVPRPLLGRFTGLWRAVSLIDGMIFNWFILVHAENHYRLILSWLAIVFGVGFMLMCLMVKEGQYPAPVESGHDHRAGGFVGGVKVYFCECFSLPHYLIVFAAFTLATLASNPINSWSLLYCKQLHLGMGSWDTAGIGFGGWRLGYGGIITLTYIFSLALAYPIGSLVDRFHALRVSTIAMLLYAASCAISYFLIASPESFGWALLAHGVLSGTYFTASGALGQLLYPRSRFSQFSSAGGLWWSVLSLVYSPALGALLDWTGSNYRITFLLSGVFSFAALAMLVIVYQRFMAMGGPAGYIAPGDTPGDTAQTSPSPGGH